MARGDGIDRTNARNMRLTETKIGNTQQHNEREKDSYINQDIVLERTPLNVHFKTPSAGYREMFSQMEADGVISTRGIKEDAFRYGELVFDVNSAYFYNHGGYDFAKQFYTEAYLSLIHIWGESVIVGYYTSRRKCLPQPRPFSTTQHLKQEDFCLWREATALIVPTQEI